MLKRFWNCFESLNKSDSVLLCNVCFCIDINSLEDVNRLVFFEGSQQFPCLSFVVGQLCADELGLVPFNLLLRLYQAGYAVVIVGTL
jgi:hypothetical protein